MVNSNFLIVNTQARFHIGPQAQLPHWFLSPDFTLTSNPVSTLAPKPNFVWPHKFFFLASKPSFPCSQIKKENEKKQIPPMNPRIHVCIII